MRAIGVGAVRVDRVPFGGAGRDPVPAASLRRSKTTVVNKLEEYFQTVSQFLISHCFHMMSLSATN